MTALESAFNELTSNLSDDPDNVVKFLTSLYNGYCDSVALSGTKECIFVRRENNPNSRLARDFDGGRVADAYGFFPLPIAIDLTECDAETMAGGVSASLN
jgi:hypothetical protein